MGSSPGMLAEREPELETGAKKKKAMARVSTIPTKTTLLLFRICGHLFSERDGLKP
jgi:hypothetical protein